MAITKEMARPLAGGAGHTPARSIPKKTGQRMVLEPLAGPASPTLASRGFVGGNKTPRRGEPRWLGCGVNSCFAETAPPFKKTGKENRNRDGFTTVFRYWIFSLNLSNKRAASSESEPTRFINSSRALMFASALRPMPLRNSGAMGTLFA